MNINFESLGKIDEIYNLLILLKDEVNNKIEKRWLTSEELALYIGYSKESIKRFLKDGEFELNYHYFKKDRKNIFDKNAIDEWIMSENKGVSINSEYLVNKLLSNVA
ncbi:helix-turn-helix domain-containing protein [Aliarcobacter cryaerophilus]|uniref:helix-turn-helix domain-containing protein n=1 Tax=Aliarcobacter cryaerophilus TaxID=28198 RepID=UPI0021B63D3F|nr:helix-turn-helix domain-containing protein [Aliarcobacter cryaerophilus]MCT7497994.1 helix-turn-helix domain-containing protein [Aliarcobacter cryaerophilus]